MNMVCQAAFRRKRNRPLEGGDPRPPAELVVEPAAVISCRACDTCWSKGKPCSFEDDFNEKFIPLFEQADTLILCMPLYFYGFPSKVQATFEKLYSLLGEDSPIKIKVKNAALLMCAGESGFDIFDGAIGTYQQLCRGLHWKDCGMILARNILEKGAIAQTDYLKKCELLGKNI